MDTAYLAALRARIGERLADALDTQKHPKIESYQKVDRLLEELLAAVPEENGAERSKLSSYFEILRERIFRDQVTHQKRRRRTVVPSTRFAISGLRPAYCRALTGRRSSHAARRRRW